MCDKEKQRQIHLLKAQSYGLMREAIKLEQELSGEDKSDEIYKYTALHDDQMLSVKAIEKDNRGFGGE